MTRSVLAVSAVLLLILLGSCRDEHDTWQQMRETGIMRVGLDPTYPPFEGLEGEELVGIDVDLAKAIARKLDLEVIFTHFGYDGLYDALLTDQVDLLISALVILPEKTEDFGYSAPYFDAGQVFVTRQGEQPADINALDSAVLAVEIGSEGHLQAKEMERSNSDISIQTYRSALEALESVAALESDVAVVDSVTARLFIATSPSLTFAPVSGAAEPYAIVVRSEDDVLLSYLDSSLNDLTQSGELEGIISGWLERLDSPFH